MLLLAACCSPSRALDNGAALTPTLGFNPWNGFHMQFNSTLIRRTAAAMVSNGLLAAGYTYITLGASTYAHRAIGPWNRSGQISANVIVRNATGFVQIDPARFPVLPPTALCSSAARTHGPLFVLVNALDSVRSFTVLSITVHPSHCLLRV